MNSTELINALQIKGSFPTSNDLFSTADFLVLFNMQLKTDLTPFMIKLNEEFYLHHKDFTISQGSTYRIPKRAIGSKIRDLKIIDSGGNQSDIRRLYEEDRASSLNGYYMLRNSIELSDDYSSGTLRMKYFMRPSKLVSTTDCAQITSINTALNQVEVSSVPSTMSTSVLVDFVQNNSPYDLLNIDVAIDSLSGATLGFSQLPNDLEIGDWVTIACESPIPMIPDELHPVLVQSALVSCLSSKKDKALEVETAELEKQKKDATIMLEPRVENNSTKMRSGKLLSYFSRRRY